MTQFDLSTLIFRVVLKGPFSVEPQEYQDIARIGVVQM